MVSVPNENNALSAALTHALELAGEQARKVEAYDDARATVKIEGNSRAYYVLRAENAEREAEQLREALDAAMQYVAPKDRDWIESLAAGDGQP